MLVSSSLVSVIVLAMGGCGDFKIVNPPPPQYINVHNPVYCGHQEAAIMPGIETAA